MSEYAVVRRPEGRRPAHFALIVMGAVLSFGWTVPRVAAQSQSLVASQRLVQGKVVGSGDTPIKGAIVYLKNSSSLEVRTYISTADGSFRFGQLSMDANYTLWAEYQGKKSKEKTISSFDTKRVVESTIKIDTNK